MPELRWTLLILGVLFIGVLTWWERRRPRHASRGGGEQRSQGEPPRVFREPTLTLPEMRARESGPPHELPLVEIADDDSLIGLRIDGRRIEDEVEKEEAAGLQASEPIVPAPPVLEPAESVSAARDVPAPIPQLPPAPEPLEPIVEWPPDDSRRIVALRLVATTPERFPGRAVRHALVAEGFVLGKFAIFHKPDEDRRAVLSAASLTKPGTFDLETMDTQRYGGLSLFAVLPGPKSAPEAFEDLLSTARNLNERLQGALQDEKGGPLTPTRVASIREGLSAEAPS